MPGQIISRSVMKQLCIAGVVAALLFVGSSRGAENEPRAFSIGKTLVDQCSTQPPSLYCLGYMAGVADMFMVLQASGKVNDRYCASMGVTRGRLAAVFSKYLREHPEQHDAAAAAVLYNALLEAFPCEEGSR